MLASPFGFLGSWSAFRVCHAASGRKISVAEESHNIGRRLMRQTLDGEIWMGTRSRMPRFDFSCATGIVVYVCNCANSLSLIPTSGGVSNGGLSLRCFPLLRYGSLGEYDSAVAHTLRSCCLFPFFTHTTYTPIIAVLCLKNVRKPERECNMMETKRKRMKEV